MNVPTIISFRDFCIRLPANPEQRRSHSKEEAKKSKRIFILFNMPKISPSSLPAFAMIRGVAPAKPDTPSFAMNG